MGATGQEDTFEQSRDRLSGCPDALQADVRQRVLPAITGRSHTDQPDRQDGLQRRVG